MASIIKVQDIQNSSGDNIINESSNTITIGASGDTITVPTGATLSNSGTLGAGMGKVLQVVSTTKTDTFTHTGSGYTVVTGLTASITPSSTSNKIFVITSINGQRALANNTVGQISIFKDGSNLINASSAGSRTPSITSGVQMGDTNGDVNSEIYSFSVLDSPSTTSSITYDIRVTNGGGAQVTYINRSESDTDTSGRGRGISTITLMEIAG